MIEQGERVIHCAICERRVRDGGYRLPRSRAILCRDCYLLYWEDSDAHPCAG